MAWSTSCRSSNSGFSFWELDGSEMCIQKDPLKGMGLFARVPIEANHVVHEETALCCSQNLDDALSGIPVCTHCLRCLESPTQVVSRVTGDSGLAAALPLADLVKPDSVVPCVYRGKGCTSIFCSVRCREAAWGRYHAVMCVGRMNATQRAAFESLLRFDWVQNGVDYSDTAFLSLRLLCLAVCQHRLHGRSLEGAFCSIEVLIHAPIDRFVFGYLLRSTSDDPTPLSDAEHWKQYQARRRDPMVCPFIAAQYHEGRSKADFVEQAWALVDQLISFSLEERAYFSPSCWSKLLGCSLLNAQERCPQSYYQFLMEAAVAVPAGFALMSEFEKKLTSVHTRPEHLVEQSHGQGIYQIGCLFNHSCEPNVQVVQSTGRDETLTVMALRRIEAGEELCISYIDENAPFPERQEKLYEHYLFDCRCPKCLREAPMFFT